MPPGQFLGAEQGANQHFLVGNGGFVQIDLPVHQAAGSEEVLNRIDAFGLYYQVVILYIQHLDNAGGANVAFGHSGIEAGCKG